MKRNAWLAAVLLMCSGCLGEWYEPAKAPPPDPLIERIDEYERRSDERMQHVLEQLKRVEELDRQNAEARRILGEDQ